MCCSCARPPLGAPRLDLGARARRVARRLRTSSVVTVTTVVVLVPPTIASVVTVVVVVVVVWVTTVGSWIPCGLSLGTTLFLTPLVRVLFSIPFGAVRCVPVGRVGLPLLRRVGLPLLRRLLRLRLPMLLCRWFIHPLHSCKPSGSQITVGLRISLEVGYTVVSWQIMSKK